MELLDYLKIIQKRWWLIALAMIIAGASAYYFNQRQPPVYSTTTTLFINPAGAERLLPNQTVQSAGALAGIYIEFTRTRSFTEAVIEGVAEEAGVWPSFREVREALSMNYAGGTQFFHITATHRNPEMAYLLANEAAEVLITQNTIRQRAQQRQIEEQLDPEARLERQRLIELQNSLEEEVEYYSGEIEEVREELDAAAPEERAALREQLRELQGLQVDLLGELANTRIALATNNSTPNADTIVVVDAATVPDWPQSQNTLTIVLLAVIIGGMWGVGLAFLPEFLDTTVKSVEQLEELYGMPVLGTISMAKRPLLKWGKRSGGETLVTLKSFHSPITEAFRGLRTNIQIGNVEARRRNLLVTSARPGEGKSFVAANLAVSLAQSGYQVILVDADLRKPSQHTIFDLSEEPGFTSLIRNPQLRPANCLQRTSVENLRVLASGPLPPNPSELLSTSRTTQVIEELEKEADLVIYDSPPAVTVVDAVILSTQADGVLQVVAAGRTSVDVVLRGKTVLERAGARILGPVLNQVSQTDFAYYSAYYNNAEASRPRANGAVKQPEVPWLLPKEDEAAVRGQSKGTT